MTDTEATNDDARERRCEMLSAIDESLFANPVYSDLTVKRGNRSWKVHRSIVCMRSSFFRKACSGKHKDDGSVTLPDGDANAVHCMLEHIYTGTFNEMTFEYKDDYEPVRLNMLVFNIANMYDLPDLAAMASEGFADYASTRWNSPAFAAVVEELYTTPMDPKQQELRDAVLQVCADNAKRLLTPPNTAESPLSYHSSMMNIKGMEVYDPKELRGVLNDVPRFAADLAARLAQKL